MIGFNYSFLVKFHLLCRLFSLPWLWLCGGSESMTPADLIGVRDVRIFGHRNKVRCI